MKTDLSVIVPIYNTEDYLSECIESIQNQTMAEIEIILVNDGSTDTSGCICDEFAKKDSRIKVIHQMNQGPISARSAGLKVCSGKYVTFVDSDDFVGHMSFAYATQAMKSDIDLIVFGIYRYYDKSSWKYQKCQYREGVYNKKDIEKEIWPTMIWDDKKENNGLDPSLCSKIMKKELLLQVYRNLEGQNFHYGEDIAVIYPLMQRIETLEVIDYSYYYHRQKGKNGIAAYVTDKEYFGKVYQMYVTLMCQLGRDKEFLKQIEYCYMHAVNYRKNIYEDTPQTIKYIFPFDKVDKNQKIILYGAGMVGRNYMNQLKKVHYCEVVLWVDKKFQRYSNQEVSSPDKIKEVVFDKIIIAVDNETLKKQIIKDLIAAGITEKKILGA